MRPIAPHSVSLLLIAWGCCPSRPRARLTAATSPLAGVRSGTALPRSGSSPPAAPSPIVTAAASRPKSSSASMPGLDRYVRPEAEQFANTASGALDPQAMARSLPAHQHAFQRRARPRRRGRHERHRYPRGDGLLPGPHGPHREAGGRRRLDAQPEHARLRRRGEPARGLPRRGRARTRAARACSSCSTTRSIPPARSRRPTRSGSSTFQSRGYGVLGVVDSDRVVFYRSVVKRHTAASEFDVDAVDELPARRRGHGLPGCDG